MENTKFTKEYFIKKFEAIDRSKFKTGSLGVGKECKCALGHCGVTDLNELAKTEEAYALSVILKPIHNSIFAWKGDWMHHVYDINDNADSLGTHPKERILKALSMVEDTKKASE